MNADERRYYESKRSGDFCYRLDTLVICHNEFCADSLALFRANPVKIGYEFICKTLSTTPGHGRERSCLRPGGP
jgi:hypothetical protein